jgi:hypothetical protein
LIVRVAVVEADRIIPNAFIARGKPDVMLRRLFAGQVADQDVETVV